MSIFGDLDVESAEDNPFAIPDNTYEAYVTEVKVGPTKAGDKIGMTIEYTIASGIKKGKKVQEWKRIPTKADLANPDEEAANQAKEAVSYLKSRMKDLGIPSERINAVEPDDLKGRHVSVTTKTKNDYLNVGKVAVWEESNDNPADPFQ